MVKKTKKACNTVNKKNVLLGGFPVKAEKGIQFPVRPDGSLMIGGKVTSPDMSADVNKYVKRGR